MKQFLWNKEKNGTLAIERNVSFEQVVYAIEQGKLLDILEHPNKDKYQSQKIFVVKIRDYVWLVPFVEDEKTIFLKTIIPSRKATKKYLPKEESEEI